MASSLPMARSIVRRWRPSCSPTTPPPAARVPLGAAVAGPGAAGATVIAIEAIKLVEGGLATICDEVWLVACERATQRARLAARGAAGGDIERRITAHGDPASRLP